MFNFNKKNSYETNEKVRVLLSSLDRRRAEPNFEDAVMAKISANARSVFSFDVFAKTAAAYLCAAVFALAAFAICDLTVAKPSSKRDAIKDMNKYVYQNIDKDVKDFILG